MDHDVRLISQLKPVMRALRKASGLTQAQLAQRLGVVQSRVADIEADPGAVSVAQWFDILAVLGVAVVLRDGDAGPPVESGARADAAPPPAPRPPTREPEDLDDPPVGRW